MKFTLRVVAPVRPSAKNFMSPPLSAASRDIEALVVEHDPGIRERLVHALRQQGYGVRACSTLAEGKQNFSRQAVVVTHANGDASELRGFVNFVRQSADPSSQPYIMAIGELSSPSGACRDQLGLDGFVPVPIEEKTLAVHFENMAQRRQPGGTTPTPPPDQVLLTSFAPVLLDALPQALALFDTGLRYLAANQPFASAFGLDRASLIGRSHYEVFPDLHAHWRQLFERALAGETGRINEDFFQRADGSSDWVRWEMRPWHREPGVIGGVLLSQEIITPRKREERRRIFDQNLSSSLFESPTLPLLLIGLDGRILRSSAATRSLLRLEPTADDRVPFWKIYPEREEQEVEQARFRWLSPPPTDGTLGNYQPGDILMAGPPIARLQWSATPHRNTNGETQAILLVGCLVPVTHPASHEVPEIPREVPAPSSLPPGTPPPDALTTHLPFGLVQLDRNGVVKAANHAANSLLGRLLPVGSAFEPWLTVAAPEDVLREPVLREWRDNVWHRQITRTFSLVSTDGLLKEIEILPQPLPDGHLLLILSDVTDARRAEDALRTSEAKYRGLFRELPTGIALVNRAGALVEANPALERLSGHSRTDLRRQHLTDLITFETNPAPTADITTRPATLLTRNGSRLPVTVTQGAIRNPAGEPVLQACFFLPRLTHPPATTEPESSAPTAPAPTAPAPAETNTRGPWRDLAFDHLAAAILVTDLDGRIRAANPAAARFFATTSHSLTGTPLYPLFRPDNPIGFSQEVSTSLATSRHWSGPLTCHDPSNRPISHCRAEISPISHSDTPGLLCLLQPVFATVA
jgi:PAS domain S-box-containing protein